MKDAARAQALYDANKKDTALAQALHDANMKALAAAESEAKLWRIEPCVVESEAEKLLKENRHRSPHALLDRIIDMEITWRMIEGGGGPEDPDLAEKWYAEAYEWALAVRKANPSLQWPPRHRKKDPRTHLLDLLHDLHRWSVRCMYKEQEPPQDLGTKDRDEAWTVTLQIRYPDKTPEQIVKIMEVDVPTSYRSGTFTLTMAPEKAASAKGEQADDTAPSSVGLRPSAQKAYGQYSEAKTRNQSLDTDDEVYDWLSENKDDDNKPYKLPRRRDTWKRYIRRARKHYGGQKNSSRAGRETGRSIVKGNEIEHQHGTDDR